MTQLVTPQLVSRVRTVAFAQLILTVVLIFTTLAVVVLLLRVQDTQDDVSHVLNDTVAAVRAGSPAAATTRNQVTAVCDEVLGPDCPHTPAEGDPFAPPPTTPAQR